MAILMLACQLRHQELCLLFIARRDSSPMTRRCRRSPSQGIGDVTVLVDNGGGDSRRASLPSRTNYGAAAGRPPACPLPGYSARKGESATSRYLNPDDAPGPTDIAVHTPPVKVNLAITAGTAARAARSGSGGAAAAEGTARLSTARVG